MSQTTWHAATRVDESKRITNDLLEEAGVLPERFESETGPVTLLDMFGPHDTLITYNWMFGPKRTRPCPMCSALLGAYDGEVPDILQRVGFAVIGRAPIDRLAAFTPGPAAGFAPSVTSSGGHTPAQAPVQLTRPPASGGNWYRVRPRPSTTTRPRPPTTRVPIVIFDATGHGVLQVGTVEVRVRILPLTEDTPADATVFRVVALSGRAMYVTGTVADPPPAGR